MIWIEFGKSELQNLDSNSMFIYFQGYDFKQNLARIKGFWTKVYHKDDHSWEVPYSCYNEILQLYADVEIRYINEPPKAKFVTNDEILNGLDFNGFNLYDYQIEGVKYGLNHHNFLLLDEQGLGKTLQIITLARYRKLHHKMKHCLIICGVNSLKWNWQKEVRKFCREEDAIVLGTRINTKDKVVDMTVADTKKQIDECPEEFFWIINIEKIRITKEDMKNNDTIVHHLNKHIQSGDLGMIAIDECHKCKNIKSSQAKGIMLLDNTASKIGMTGTLLVNNPLDLYCPMSFVGLLTCSMFQFEQKYVVKNDWNQVIGYQNIGELHDILYRSSLRRTKALLDLPPKMYKQEWLEFNEMEQKLFNEIITGKNIKLLDKVEYNDDYFAVCTRMRQAIVAPELLSTYQIGHTKFDRLNDILEEAKLNSQKVLVFCPFTEVLKLGLEYCKEYKPKLICGGMGAKLDIVKEEHESTNGFSVLFAQEATLGVGHTLTNTEIVVFLSPPWNRATYDQCVDRLHRIGQKKTVQIIDLLIKDTYDELIYTKLHGKGAMSDILIDGEETEAVKSYLNNMGIVFNQNKQLQQEKLY